MRFLMLVCVDDELAGTVDANPAAWVAETTAKRQRIEGNQLRPVSDATTVRVRDGEVLVADGPFAETKEQVGGYYVVDCEDLDEAIEVASKIPAARYGTIEVRPIWEM